jgi:hypothetical protein|tara:strand:- start:70 stop:402 length:333 start_codon:yes stop_codon:yes gene_type:complete
MVARSTIRPADWSVTTLGSDNAVATAAKAAVAETQHYLTSVVASFDESAVALLTIADGVATRFQIHVFDSEVVTFDAAMGSFLRGDPITASLAAGGSGIAGSVTITGYSD